MFNDATQPTLGIAHTCSMVGLRRRDRRRRLDFPISPSPCRTCSPSPCTTAAPCPADLRGPMVWPAVVPWHGPPAGTGPPVSRVLSASFPRRRGSLVPQRGRDTPRTVSADSPTPARLGEQFRGDSAICLCWCMGFGRAVVMGSYGRAGYQVSLWNWMFSCVTYWQSGLRWLVCYLCRHPCAIWVFFDCLMVIDCCDCKRSHGLCKVPDMS